MPVIYQREGEARLNGKDNFLPLLMRDVLLSKSIMIAQVEFRK